MRAIKTYYEKINQEIDNTHALRGFFYTPKHEKVPKFKQIIFDAINKNNTDLSREDKDVQKDFLTSRCNFADWTNAQSLCDLSISRTVTANLVEKKLLVKPTDPERFLLEHFFKTMYENSSVKSDIINLKRSVQPIKASFKNSLRETSEKIVQKTADFFSHPTTRRAGFVIAFAVSFIAGVFFLSAVVNTITSLIQPYSPATAKIIRFLDSGEFFFVLYSLENVTRNIPVLHKWVIYPVWKGYYHTLLLPTRIISASISIISTYVWTKLPLIANQMRAISSKWNDFRLGQEYCEARDLWVNTFLKERNIKRAEVEYDYARAELDFMIEKGLPFLKAEQKVLNTEQAFAQLSKA